MHDEDDEFCRPEQSYPEQPLVVAAMAFAIVACVGCVAHGIIPSAWIFGGCGGFLLAYEIIASNVGKVGER